jgi:hypothetical protein
MDFLRDPIWQFIGVIVSAIGIVISLIITANSEKNKIRPFFVKTLLFAFLIVTLILTSMVLKFASANSPNLSFLSLAPPTIATPRTVSPLSQAQAMLRQYFDKINKRNYCDAYDMWAPNSSSCQQFSQGFLTTGHIDITFDSTQSTLSSDGKVYLTQYVTNKDGDNANEPTVYHGWFVVEQENGIWKIKSGHFN